MHEIGWSKVFFEPVFGGRLAMSKRGAQPKDMLLSPQLSETGGEEMSNGKVANRPRALAPIQQILTVATAVSMIIIASTTRFDYRDGRLVVWKEAANPEPLKAATQMIGEASG